MAQLSQIELAAAILDIVPQMDAEVVTIRIIMEKLAARFGVDLETIRAQKAAIKQLVMSSYGAEEPREEFAEQEGGDAEKENAGNASRKAMKSSSRLQESPAKRRAARNTNTISDDSEDEASEREDDNEEEEDAEDGGDSDSQASGSDSEAPKRKRASSKASPAKRTVAAPKREKASKKAPAAKKPRQIASTDSPGIAALKELARAARLLSPRVYASLKKLESEQEQEALIRDLLRANGVTFSGRYPQKREIDDVRKKKELEKDLEGIDTSLIIKDTSSRSRRRSAVSYADQLRNRPMSDDDAEDEDEGVEAVEREVKEDDGSESRRAVVKKRKRVEESEEESEDDEDDAFEANDSDSSEAEF